jgi:hypothetical protein
MMLMAKTQMIGQHHEDARRGLCLRRQGAGPLRHRHALADQLGQVVERLGEAAAGLALQAERDREEGVFGDPGAVIDPPDRLIDGAADRHLADDAGELVLRGGAHLAADAAQRLAHRQAGADGAHHQAERVRDLDEQRIPVAAVLPAEDESDDGAERPDRAPGPPVGEERDRQARHHHRRPRDELGLGHLRAVAHDPDEEREQAAVARRGDADAGGLGDRRRPGVVGDASRGADPVLHLPVARRREQRHRAGDEHQHEDGDKDRPCVGAHLSRPPAAPASRRGRGRNTPAGR